MKWLRVILASFTLFVVIVIGALFALTLLIDPNQLKPTLINLVKAKTGYDLVLEDTLSWSLYPRLSIKASRAQLVEPVNHNVVLSLQEIKWGVDVIAWWQNRNQTHSQLSIANAQYGTYYFGDVSAEVLFNKGEFVLSPLTANFAGGILSGSIALTLPTHTLNYTLQLQQAQLASLWRQINPDSAVSVSGTGDISLHGQTVGASKEERLQHLQGFVNWQVVEGAIDGVDFNYYVQAAQAFVQNQELPQPVQPYSTRFTRFIGSGPINAGVFTVQTLQMDAPAFVLLGKGNVNLPLKQLDLTVALQVQRQTRFQIPVLISGDWRHPEVRLDTQAIKETLGKLEIETLKTKAEKLIEKNFHGKTREFLNNILGD